jgi:hypothetical protein
MSGVTDANTCLRRGMCKPMGGAQVYSSFTSKLEKSSIFVTATLDATSFFHDLSQGALKSVTGVVALLAVAQSLSQVCMFELVYLVRECRPKLVLTCKLLNFPS